MPNPEPTTPETAAEELLERLGVRSVPISVERVAKALHAQVRYSPLDNELSGMVFIKDGESIIGVNSLHHQTGSVSRSPTKLHTCVCMRAT